MIVCLPNAVAPQRGRPPLPGEEADLAPRADASRPTTTNSSAGDRDGDFPVSTTLASISSGFFASTYGAVVPVLLHWGRQRPELARFSAHGRFRPARPAGSLAGTSRAATGEDFLAPSGHPRHERSAKSWAKLEPAAALLSCYALVQSDNAIPLSPRTKHFLMRLRRRRYWESFPQGATLLLSGTRPEGADTGLGAGG